MSLVVFKIPVLCTYFSIMKSYITSFKGTLYVNCLCSECVEKKFGEGVMDRLCTTIRCKVNQKCLDILNKRIKKEGKENIDLNHKERSGDC